MEDRDLEDAQELGLGVMLGELQGVVVGGDPWDEAEDADEEEDRADGEGRLLYPGAGCCGGVMSRYGKGPFRGAAQAA
ncbi:hypothetical protein GCM10010353_68450 [Streptomyces chryseus]|nr:hypothetical protein GCM10010353_68450 [Streptomyces chryseus]